MEMYTYDDFKYCPIPQLAKSHELVNCIKIITNALDVDDANCSINFISFILFLRKLSALINIDDLIYIVIEKKIVLGNWWLLFRKQSVFEHNSLYNNIDDMIKSFEQRIDGFDKIIIYKINSSQIIGYIELEKWAEFGGPQPYSDSFTFAVYLDKIKYSRIISFLDIT